MVIDQVLSGAVGPPIERSWNSRDCLLYALAVGASDEELAFTTDNSAGIPQLVLPTFAVIPGSSRGAFPSLEMLDRTKVVHGKHALEVRGPIPTEGKVTTESRVADVKRKRGSVVVTIETISSDAITKAKRFSERRTLVVSTVGSFNLGSGRASTEAIPSRSPDELIKQQTGRNQALLYRLCDDRNPLHSDPSAAEAAGLERPLLHGLCTFGFIGRALLRSLCGMDPGRFLAMEARFTAPVFPGETLITSIWSEGNSATFITRTATGRTCVDQGTFRFS